MACMTLLAPPMAVTTTQLARAIHYEVAAPWQTESPTERFNALRMSWVVITDVDGKKRLHMHWSADESDQT